MRIARLLIVLSFALVFVARDAQAGTSKLSCTTNYNISRFHGLLYKNANEHGGRGRTLLDQDYAFSGARRLYVADVKKNIFSCFGLYRCDYPFGCRYYQAMCGDRMSNSAFISRARRGGSTNVLVGLLGKKNCLIFNGASSRAGNIRK